MYICRRKKYNAAPFHKKSIVIDNGFAFTVQYDFKLIKVMPVKAYVFRNSSGNAVYIVCFQQITFNIKPIIHVKQINRSSRKRTSLSA